MKLLVTGAAGYLGSQLIKTILDNNSSDLNEFMHVIGVDNLMYDNLYSVLPFIGDNFYFEFIKCNLLELDAKVISSVDAVIHLAAIVGQPACDRLPKESQDVNVEATKRLVTILGKDQYLCYPNTNSGYGTSGDEICTEETPMNPISSYGRQKCEAEKIVMQHNKAVVLRLATVFGLSNRPRLDLLVNNLAYQSYFNKHVSIFQPEFRRNYVHIQDVVDTMIRCVSECWKSDVFNFGNDKLNMTKGNLAEFITGHFGATFDYKDGTDPDQRDYYVSSDKLRNKYDCWADYSLYEGITELHGLFDLLPSDSEKRTIATKSMYNS